MTADLQSAVQRALSAWDTTTLKTNGDGMLSEAMESLRIEFDSSVQAPAEGDAPFAWATFDGEGGFDLCLYDGNESHRDDYIKCNGPQFMSWVTPLYASKVQPKGKAVAWRMTGPADYGITSYDKEQVEQYVANGWEVVQELYDAPSPAPGAEQEQTTDSPEYLKSMGAWLGAVGDLFIAMGRPDIPGDTPVDSIAEIIREAAKRLAVQASAVAHADSLAKALESAMHGLTMRGDRGTSPVYKHCEKVLEDYRSKARAEAPQVGHAHRWDDVGERCVKCGDKDWMGCPCSVPDAPAKPIGVEVVGVVRDLGGDDGLTVEWLLEGGLHAVAEGGGETYLMVSHEPITDDDGHGEVYRTSDVPVQGSQP